MHAGLWSKVAILKATWEPMMRTLRMFDAQQARLHMLYPALKQLEREARVHDPEGLLPGFASAVTSSFAKRWDYLRKHTPGFLLAHALNPAFINTDLDDDVTRFTFEYFKSAGDAANVILRRQFRAFRARVGIDPSDLEDVRDPFAWWLTAPGNSRLLSQVARRAMLLTGTATECERAWKDYNGVVTLKRNRLSRERAAKLVKLYHHMHRTPRRCVRVAQSGAAASARRIEAAGAGPAAQHSGLDSGDDVVVENEWDSSDYTPSDVHSAERHRIAPMGTAATPDDSDESDDGSTTFGDTLDADEYLLACRPTTATAQGRHGTRVRALSQDPD